MLYQNVSSASFRRPVINYDSFCLFLNIAVPPFIIGLGENFVGVSVERSCQILGLRVFPDNPKYYQVLIVLVFPRSSPYYWIPRGYKYQIFYGNEQWNDIFYLMSGSTSILEYQGFGSLSNNNNVVQNYYISKDAILIKGLPA